MDKKVFPFAIEQLETKINQELMEYFIGEFTGFVSVGPKKYILPDKYRTISADIYNLQLRPDDICVITYPRSGTTWMQEMVWLIMNDVNYKSTNDSAIYVRWKFLEYPALVHPKMMEKLVKDNINNKEAIETYQETRLNALSTIDDVPSPRFIKTHLPLSLLPPTLHDTARAIYVARDPRDVAVSYYHHNRLQKIHGYIGDFKRYWDYFVEDLITYAPYFEHLKEAWDQRHNPNMLFIFYEDMSKDLKGACRRVARFLNKELTEEQIIKLCEFLTIDNFKINYSANIKRAEAIGLFNKDEEAFIRKGKVGGWREYFDEEMMSQAKQWMEFHLKGTGIKFPS